jgi:hypothetical protein
MSGAVPPLPKDASPGGPAADDAASQPLRLTIAHLMLWTLGTAIALALFRPFLETQAPSGSETAARYIAFQKFAALSLIPFGGASIAALIFAVVHRVRGGRLFPVQPGHWLLIVFGISYLLLALNRLLLMLRTDAGSSELAVYFWGNVGASIVMICVYALPIASVRDAPRWTILFVVELLRRVGQLPSTIYYALMVLGVRNVRPMEGFMPLANGLSWFMYVVSTVVLIVTLIREIKARPNRDYLHWTGCLTQFVLAINNMSYFVVPWLIR